MVEQTEIRKKMRLAISYKLPDKNITAALHDKPEEKRSDDATRKNGKIPRPSTSLKGDKSIRLTLVDSSTATGRVDEAFRISKAMTFLSQITERICGVL